MSTVIPLPEQALAAIEGAPEAEEGWQAAVARLSKLSPIEYDRVREAEAGKLGVRVTTLDAEVEKLRPGGAKDDAQGREVTFPVFEPHPLPVDGAALLEVIASAVLRFMAMQPAAADAVALWVMHAHCHDAADHSPVLAITSPEKRCGKTTLLRILRTLCPKAMPSANVTPSAVFRSIAKYKPTLLIDEADTFLRDSEDLRGVLNSGHGRSDAFITRNVGDNHEPRQFATWAPKAIAAIGKLHSTIEDRAIPVALQRKGSGDPVERWRDRGPAAEALASLHRQAVRWAADHGGALVDADPGMPGGLHDRACDNWRPLLAIADLAGGGWPERARAAALALSGGEEAEDQSVRTMLLADIKGVFEERDADRITSEDLARDLAGMEHRPWPEWKAGKPITPTQVARLLAPFGIKPKVMRFGDKTPAGYERSAFGDAFARYLPDTPFRSSTPQHLNENNGLSGNRSSTRAGNVEDRNEANSLTGNTCCRVEDQLPHPPAEEGDDSPWEGDF